MLIIIANLLTYVLLTFCLSYVTLIFKKLKNARNVVILFFFFLFFKCTCMDLNCFGLNIHLFIQASIVDFTQKIQVNLAKRRTAEIHICILQPRNTSQTQQKWCISSASYRREPYTQSISVVQFCFTTKVYEHMKSIKRIYKRLLKQKMFD